MKEQHASHLRKRGAYLHQLLNLRKENVLSTPALRCTWSAKKDLSISEMDALTKSCSPTLIITASGEVQTHEEATVYVKVLDIFLTGSPPKHAGSMSLGKLCDENDILTNGSMVKNHFSWKTGFEYSATRRTSFRSRFLGLSNSSSGSGSPTSRTLSR